MIQVGKTLYARNKNGSIQEWNVFVEGPNVIVQFGKQGGKVQTKITVCEAKNVGRSNETTPEQQAVLEANAKLVKQMKSGYFECIETARNYIKQTPMKAQNYIDHASKVKYPCYLQPKLNGLRNLNLEGKLLSKSGEPYNVPPHWAEEFTAYGNKFALDGEVFAGYQKQGGLSLQKINSAWKKYNEDTPKLKYYVYDIPVRGIRWSERLEFLLLDFKNSLPPDSIFVVVEGKWCYSEEEATEYYRECLENGAEGVVYRNADSLYEFGTRSYGLIKRKPREDAEALVISSRKDKNNSGVLTCQLQSGVMFECLMKVELETKSNTENYRAYEKSLELIGKFIKFEYEEFSDEGVPKHPCGVDVRPVDRVTWESLE